jgi:TolA-binding protein
MNSGSRARKDADVQRLLLLERNRATLTARHQELLATRLRSLLATGAADHVAQKPTSTPRAWWLTWVPAAAAAILLLGGGALAITAGWRRSEPAREASLPRRAAPVSVAAAPTSPALRDELDLLSKARQALSDKAYDRAARHLADHGRRYPAGALIEEREGLAVMLLWHTGDVSNAKVATRRFQLRYPDSPLNRPIRALSSATTRE